MTFTVVHALDTVASTMDVAREKVRAGAPAGTVITAQFQTGGRGRRGKTWFAPHGANVMLTATGGPVPVADAWQIALVAGVAVAEAIADGVPTVTPHVRFPNDVYLNGKKLAGVLIETVPDPKSGFVVPLIGIGVNGNCTENDFPPDLRPTATSLLRETGRETTISVLCDLILHRLGERWESWRHGSLDATIIPRWNALADPAARRVFVVDGTPVSCRVVRLDRTGSVVLEMPSGETRTLPAAQVILGDT